MNAVPREVCLRCRRPALFCYCARLPTLPTRTRIVLLQHPREARMPVGTARMAHLALPSSELHQGVFFQENARVQALLGEPGTALLFPGEGAIDPRDVAPGDIRTLVVIDGTWSQARKVLKQNPALQRLRRVGLKPERPGNYRIRREPTPDALATIEAVAAVLGVLEGAPERFETMLDAFTYMVDQQIERIASSNGPRRWMRPRVHGLIAEDRLLATLHKVVLLHVEVNAHKREVSVPGRPELLHLVAHRTTGETFEATLAPRRPLAPSAPHQLGISAERLLSGESVDSARARWQAFSRPDDLLAGWGTFVEEVLRRDDLVSQEYIDLRPVVARRFQSSPGSPMAALARFGSDTPLSVGSGRAGRTVGALAQLVPGLARNATSSPLPQ